jgi:hypothetical protein
MKREGLFPRPAISRELRTQIEAERRWIERRSAEMRERFFAIMAVRSDDPAPDLTDELVSINGGRT